MTARSPTPWLVDLWGARVFRAPDGKRVLVMGPDRLAIQPVP